MNLNEILSIIQQIVDDKGLSEAFICGGIPRDKVMNKLGNIVDLDITTGNSDVHILGREFANKLNIPFEEMPDKHIQTHVGEIKVDFSSNFVLPEAKALLSRAGLKNPTPLQLEQYSRDFTCNSLLMTLDLKNIKDPIGMGIKDIDNKILKTCFPARLTLGHDNKRVVRVLYLSSKLGFKIDEEIVEWIKKNPKAISNVDQSYLVKKLNASFKEDPENTVRLLDYFGLWDYIPLRKEIMKQWINNIKTKLNVASADEQIIKESKKEKRVDLDVRPVGPFAKNYDYGEPGIGTGLYRGYMDRFKSVTDFLEHSRKQRKKRKKKLMAEIFSILNKTAGSVVPYEVLKLKQLNSVKLPSLFKSDMFNGWEILFYGDNYISAELKDEKTNVIAYFSVEKLGEEDLKIKNLSRPHVRVRIWGLNSGGADYVSNMEHLIKSVPKIKKLLDIYGQK